MWNDHPRYYYFKILEEFKDRIIIELAGHDHLESLRTHKIDNDNYFHNLLVAPSITPWYNNNPGVSSLTIDGDLVARNLKSTYLNLAPTIGPISATPFDELEFRELDFAKQFGIKDLSAESIYKFALRLAGDEKLHKEYLIRKMGFYPSIPAEAA